MQEASRSRRISLLGLASSALVIGSVTCGLAQGSPHTGEAASEQVGEIRRANEAFHRAWSDRDLWAMGQVWAKEGYASAIHPAHPVPFLGWESVRASWKQTFAHNRDISIRSRAGAVHQASATIAWVIESIRLEGVQTQTGQPFLMDNLLSTKIFERHGDEWLLVHFHGHLPHLASPDVHELEQVSKAVSSPAEESVEQANEAFFQAWSGRDLRAMGVLWAKEGYVSAIHPAHPVPFLGWESVRASWQELFARDPDVVVHSHGGTRHVAGPVAWVADSTMLASVPTHGGPPVLYSILSTKIFEEREGEWLLIHYHAHRTAHAGHALHP
jgi:ketosteroid isomerase-like protein